MEQEECFPVFWVLVREAKGYSWSRPYTTVDWALFLSEEGSRDVDHVCHHPNFSETGSVYGFPLCFPKEVGAGLCTRGR